MAEEDKSQEKTEEPTPKRLEKAREEGQVARSKELNTTAVILAGTGGLLVFGSSIAATLERMMRFNFSFDRSLLTSDNLMLAYLGRSFAEVGVGLFPLFLVLLIAALVGPIGLGGWLFSAKAMAPKFSRLNPIEGLKRMFSLNSLLELAKSIAKVSIVSFLAVMLILNSSAEMMSVAAEAVKPAIVHATTILGWAALALAASTIVIVIVDVPYQIWDHSRKQKMTMQEVKDEMKDMEGKPEVKGRIRQLQREIAQRRMMSAVPEADVVITNPTHYAVALKYDTEGDGAPLVVARGVDQVALKIREIADAHDVYVLEAPPLARAIYFTTELDEEIPEGLYLAVAQILAYVYQLKRYRPGQGRKPKRPSDYDIPPDLQFDR